MTRLAFEIEGETPEAVATLVASLFGGRPADGPTLLALTDRLSEATDPLAAAVAANGGDTTRTARSDRMPNPVLQALSDQVEQTTTVMASAKVLIGGFAQRVQDAITAAIANGATAEELAPVQDEVNALKAGSDDLARAVEANTTP